VGVAVEAAVGAREVAAEAGGAGGARTLLRWEACALKNNRRSCVMADEGNACEFGASGQPKIRRARQAACRGFWARCQLFA